LRIAYLINQYPQTSQSFIRREIEALEAGGTEVLRFTVRPVVQPLVDQGDEAERQKTRAVLNVGALGLARALLGMALTHPRAFLQALRLAIRFGRPSDRGLLIHLIYLAEACVLTGWLLESKVGHVHAHFGTNSTTIAALCRTLGGPPFSFTVHGPEEFDSPKALGLGEKVRLASFVLGISEFTRSQIYRWADHADWSKIHVVRCGLDPSYLDGSGPVSPNSSRRLLCIGRLAEQKGQLLLVEAAGKLRDRGVDFELVLVGDGPMRGEIERLIDRLKLGDRVRLAGWMSKPEVRQALVDTRVMVLPSFAEGLPVVLMEALAIGRPVITTYVAGIPELVTPEESGWLVPAGSVDALVEVMAQALAATPAELERMGRIGSARVAVQHDAAIEAGKIATLIREAVQLEPSPR
jgi:glycosyltransferase involved in cell wall biosynthesis